MMLQPDLPPTDPIPTPPDLASVETVRTAWAAGAWALVVVGVLLIIARGLYWAAQKHPTNGVVHALRLGQPRVRAVIVGTIGVLGALSVELAATTGVNWEVVVGAICAAVALFMRPEPKDHPSTIATSKPAPPTVRAQ